MTESTAVGKRADQAGPTWADAGDAGMAAMLVAEFEGNAMAGRQFAAPAGIKTTTLSNWVRKWRKPRSAQLSAPAVENALGERWLEVVLDKPTPKRSKKR